MNTQELNQKIERERAELATIEAGLTQARASLQANSDKREAAQEIAARIMVLEARHKAIQANSEQTQKELDTLVTLTNSREYIKAQKRMAEIEGELSQCEQTANGLLQQLQTNNERAGAIADEYFSLIDKYCVDLDNVSKGARKRNKSYAFVFWVARLIAPVFEERKHREALQRHGIKVN